MRHVQPRAPLRAQGQDSHSGQTVAREPWHAQGREATLRRLEAHVDGWAGLLAWLDPQAQRGCR